MEAGGLNTLDVFRDIVEVAHKARVRVHFFINPVHARMMVALREAGLWPVYERWKRRLVEVNETVARKLRVRPLPIWDFSGANSITSEPVPEPGDTTSVMKYWWEPSHYRSATGRLILDRVLGYKDPRRPVPEDFGARLTRQSIDAWLVKVRDGVVGYMRRFPKEAKRVTEAVAKVMATAVGANCGYDAAAAKAGGALLRKGDRAGAEAAFRRAIALHQQEARRYAKLGVPFRETGFPSILARARRGERFGKPLASWQAYSNRGHRRVVAGDLRGAVDDFNQMIRLAPPLAVNYRIRGNVKLMMKDLAGALADFRAGLAIDPKDAPLKLMARQTSDRIRREAIQAATAELAAKRYTAAIKRLRGALKVLPNDPVLRAALAAAEKRGT